MHEITFLDNSMAADRWSYFRLILCHLVGTPTILRNWIRSVSSFSFRCAFRPKRIHRKGL